MDYFPWLVEMFIPGLLKDQGTQHKVKTRSNKIMKQHKILKNRQGNDLDQLNLLNYQLDATKKQKHVVYSCMV